MKEEQILSLTKHTPDKGLMISRLFMVVKTIAVVWIFFFIGLKPLAAQPVFVSYDILSKQYLNTSQHVDIPFSSALNDICLARKLLEAVLNGELKLQTEFPVSAKLLASVNTKPKKIILQSEQNISVKDLLRALVLIQANEASVIARQVLSSLNEKEKGSEGCFREGKEIDGKNTSGGCGVPYSKHAG